MTTQERLVKLIGKYLDGSATQAEVEEVEQWYSGIDNSPVTSMRDATNEEAIRDMLVNIRKEIASHQKTNVPVVEMQQRRYPWTKYASIAAALIIIALGTWIFVPRSNDKDQVLSSVDQRYKNDISPGSDRAILTLADGSQIILDKVDNGVVTSQGSSQIHKLNDGLISYENTSVSGQAVSFNSVSTPRGGQYAVILPDGSKVWLNAASSLRFPITFTGDERKVEITGEAYFEVAKNKKMPFKVSVGGMEVKVLGTHFNITAYTEESSIKTTLLEGSVLVTKGDKDVLLKPGQQSRLTSDNSIQIKSDVNTESVVAWKDGNFDFDNGEIAEVLRQIERWYNVEVVYEKPLLKANFTGIISRANTLSTVLKILEASGVHTRLEGKKIIVQ